MLLESDIKKIFSDLIHHHSAEISYAGTTLSLKIWEDKLSLTAPVYWGGNYIPKSVRECIRKKPPFDEGVILTTLHLNEEKFEITLAYQGSNLQLNKSRFVDLIEEFSFLANEWREWLDQHDKNDLVHVRVPI